MSTLNIQKHLPNLQLNVLLAPYTTFKIGGPARYFYQAESKEEIVKVVEVARKLKMPFFVLGGGSNVLVSDKGFNGLVVKIENKNTKTQKHKNTIECGAGVTLSELINFTIKNELTGLEWMAGIPGSVGGAIRGNAGAFGGCMADVVERVEVLEIDNPPTPRLRWAGGKTKVKRFNNKQCEFKYRDSIFKYNQDFRVCHSRPDRESSLSASYKDKLDSRFRGNDITNKILGKRENPDNKNLIILSCEIKLQKGDKQDIENKIAEHLKYRQENHPSFPSAGCIFKNPTGSTAGALIDSLELKGFEIGGAKVSEKHANFIVNIGQATAKDVLTLVDLIKRKVEDKVGVRLEEEFEYVEAD